MSVYNMDHPVHRWLHARQGRAAARDQPRHQHAAGDPSGTQIEAIPAQSPTMPNTIGSTPTFAVKMVTTTLARAKALLDLYGYVDRNGDGWREQPSGEPLTLEVSTEPSQANRQLAELVRKDMDFAWPSNILPRCKVAGEFEEHAFRQIHGLARRAIGRLAGWTADPRSRLQRAHWRAEPGAVQERGVRRDLQQDADPAGRTRTAAAVR